MKYLGMVMAFVYVAAGIAVLLQPPEHLIVSKKFAVPFGIMLIAYGAFRGYNTFKKSS